jgi:NTP pyrophosphatase (non-canonical NTP hydrolase)
MSDYSEVLKKIKQFNTDRGWKPSPQDLAKSVVIEAAELLELFQWDASDELENRHLQPKDQQAIKFEVADVFWYLATFSEKTGINLLTAVEEKFTHLEKKYPKELFNGHHNEEAYLRRKKLYRTVKK